MESILIDIALGVAIGLSLGFLGGGGSILTVPALVYAVGLSPQTAVTTSLIIVGANAALGAYFHRNQGTLNWRVALVFGGAGMAGAFLSAGLSEQVSSTMLMILFAILMLAVGVFMLFSPTPASRGTLPRGVGVTLSSGAGVGVLTGFLGVGGGFLIVPALVMLVGLPIQQAVGTSLVVIAMNSLAGLLGHLGTATLDYEVIALFVASGFIGSFAGARLARVARPGYLRAGFAVFVMLLGAVLLIDNLGRLP